MENENRAPAKQVFKFDILYFIAVVFAVLLIRDLLVGQSHVKVIPYSEFQSLVEKDGVTDLVVGPTQITGAYKQPVDKGAPAHFSTV
ncbi:MAG: ATP-dependent metallopeptidase FtsH/Yme1/Tma family protein, partial [Mesorhizobium sp.]|nr:ATP-dependent metallopeptidase FtsH/Yme1/Tma family protein [Mesorhizobium sp.]